MKVLVDRPRYSTATKVLVIDCTRGGYTIRIVQYDPTEDNNETANPIQNHEYSFSPDSV